jgi:hypothetical protein
MLLITSKLSDLSHSSNHTQEEEIENKKGFTYYGQALLGLGNETPLSVL